MNCSVIVMCSSNNCMQFTQARAMKVYSVLSKPKLGVEYRKGNMGKGGPKEQDKARGSGRREERGRQER
jgi:hypothetical protein